MGTICLPPCLVTCKYIIQYVQEYKTLAKYLPSTKSVHSQDITLSSICSFLLQNEIGFCTVPLVGLECLILREVVESAEIPLYHSTFFLRFLSKKELTYHQLGPW